jgi:hypothetical protein
MVRTSVPTSRIASVSE